MIGTLPPPYGGVSIHVVRLLERLRAAQVDARVYEQRGKQDLDNGVIPLGRNPLHYLALLLLNRDRILHLQFNAVPALCLAGLVLPARGRRYLVTVHSERLFRVYSDMPLVARWLLRRLIARCVALVCVSESIAESVPDVGCSMADKVHVIPAFLPPQQSETNESLVPRRVLDFVSKKKQVIVSHGWFGYFIDDCHVYGFDLLVALANHLKNAGDGRCLVTIISGSYDESHRQTIYKAQDPLSDVWLISEDAFPATSLFAKADMFVRPTRTDGDSVSVRECLMMGVPVVASNAVKRPAECLLFRNGSQSDFLRTVDQALKAPGTRFPVQQREAEPAIVGLIKSLLEKK